MNTLKTVCIVLQVLLFACYAHQIVYLFYALIKKPATMPDAAPRRYAVLIAARNEEAVVGELIKSIRAQRYPADLLDIFVVADNCTDGTAHVSREAGARVWERFDSKNVGKGYALDFLFKKIRSEYEFNSYEGFFVFDADNLLDENYIGEMNKTFAAGHRIITSYRNSKNYGDNWISAGYSLWFLRDSRLLNGARMMLGTSCAVAGTGFLVHREIIEKAGGWKYFLLTEDTEFTIDMLTRGERVAYCGSAVLYDEQPTTFMQSWWQRMRWVKGYLQVFRDYGGDILKGLFSRNWFACFDVAMAFLPAIVVSILNFCVSMASAVAGLGNATAVTLLGSILMCVFSLYGTLLLLGAVTTFAEWKSIYAITRKKLAYIFTFPIFVMSYFPIAIAALFQKVSWRPIKHDVKKTLDQVKAA